MVSKEDFEDLQERFDGRYVLRDNCDEYKSNTARKLSNDDKRLAVIEQQQKVNNWLTAAIATGIIALVIKIFLGG